MTHGPELAIVPFGDGALLVTLAAPPTVETARRVHALAGAIRSLHDTDATWKVPVPGLESVLAPFEPLMLPMEEAQRRLREALEHVELDATTAPSDEPITVAVRYGGDDGPDLTHVANRLGIAERDVVALHTQRAYEVLILGFAPGFAYLGSLVAELSLPRRDTPRTRVPAGSVAIAGSQTAIYPGGTAGGWHLIGRTDTPVWDATREPPALLRPGMRVRFVSTDSD